METSNSLCVDTALQPTWWMVWSVIFKTHPVIAELEVLGKVATDGMGPPERGQSPSFCPTLIDSDNELLVGGDDSLLSSAGAMSARTLVLSTGTKRAVWLNQSSARRCSSTCHPTEWFWSSSSTQPSFLCFCQIASADVAVHSPQRSQMSDWSAGFPFESAVACREGCSGGVQHVGP